jgi:hypothetical protein
MSEVCSCCAVVVFEFGWHTDLADLGVSMVEELDELRQMVSGMSGSWCLKLVTSSSSVGILCVLWSRCLRWIECDNFFSVPNDEVESLGDPYLLSSIPRGSTIAFHHRHKTRLSSHHDRFENMR